MKRSRLLTAAGAALAVGVTALATTGVANAAPDPTVQYANSASAFTTSTTPFDSNATGWVAAGPTTPTLTFGPGGVTLDGTSPLILSHTTDAPVSSLTDLVGSEQLVTTAGSAFLGWALSDTAGGQYYVIATTPGDTFTPTSTFSLEVDGTNNTGLTPDANYTLAQLQAAFDADTTAQFDAYGITNFPYTVGAPIAATTVAAIEFDGATTYFTPTPQPLTITPTTTTLTGFKSGVTVSGTGFFPGETVTTGYGSGQSGNDLTTTFTADANGDVTGVLPVPSATAAGTYTLVLAGSTSNVVESGIVTVTADPAASTPAAPNAPVAVPVRATATFTG